MCGDLFSAIEAVSPLALRRLSVEELQRRVLDPATTGLALVQLVTPRRLADLEALWVAQQERLADEAVAGT
jgi:hypothetical protein